MIGVDVLADHRDLADAGIGKPLRFRDDLCNRARDLGAARIGHDAEGAELVAAFLDGDEGGDAARAHRLARRILQKIEFVFRREFGFDRPLAARGLFQQRRQAMIALRPDHEIDRRRAPHDLGAFGLRDAAGDRDGDAASGARRLVLHDAQASELGIDLLRRLLADVAGIEHDEIGVVDVRGLGESFRSQHVRHTKRIVGVHLAAVGFDVELAGSGHAARSGAVGAECVKVVILES